MDDFGELIMFYFGASPSITCKMLQLKLNSYALTMLVFQIPTTLHKLFRQLIKH